MMQDPNASAYMYGLGPNLSTQYSTQVPTAGAAKPSGMSGADIGKAALGFGTALQLGAGVINAIGAYGAAQAQQADYRMKALNAKSREYMAQLGASQARIVAGQIMQAGAQARRQLGQQAGQQQAQSRTRQALRGVTNAGSAAEVQASLRYKQQAEELTLDTNTMRQRQAAERRRVDMLNRAGQERVAAANALDMAGAISPGLAFATALLSGVASAAGSVANFYGSGPK